MKNNKFIILNNLIYYIKCRFDFHNFLNNEFNMKNLSYFINKLPKFASLIILSKKYY